MKEINLGEILNTHLSIEISQKISETETLKSVILDAMLDFGKQLLELAAENARINLLIDEENDIVEEANIDKQSILNTINQVK